jgi:hypothetical protein
MFGLAVVPGVEFGAGVFWDMLTTNLGPGLVFGLYIWLVLGLGTALSAGLTRPEVTDTSPLTPLASWRRDQTARLVAGLVGGLVAGLMVGLILGLLSSPGSSVVQGLIAAPVAGLPIGLVFGLAHSETWAVSLAFIQLTTRQHTPVRLMRFLEDARERHVLRTVGPVYQFRHARLQDRLAGTAGTTRVEPQLSQTVP